MVQTHSDIGSIPLASELKEAIQSFQPPQTLGFGTCIAPAMIQSTFTNGTWSNMNLVAYEDLSISPACKSLHYGQLIFEGLKAYAHPDGNLALFRPYENARRFNDSAQRMAMPTIPEEQFVNANRQLVHALGAHVPSGTGESLYLRPFMIALDEGLGLKASDHYMFIILASPSGGYFETNEVSALVERSDSRAAPGGTGAYKVAGNYGASIRSSIKAKELSYQQTLWLDAKNNRYLEELSGMNIFCVIDGELHTPELNSSILPGITRDSILKLATHHGLKAHEGQIDIEELISAIKEKRCSEIFACGTAAVVTPIHSLGEKDGTRYYLSSPEKSVSQTMLKALTDIQYGHCADPFQWVLKIAK